jgi:hypothetical protein
MYVSFGGGKVSTQARRGRTLAALARIPQFRRIAWELSCIIEHHGFTHHHSSNPPSTRISLLNAKMSQPVVQTIHRDPALLYVVSMKGCRHR